MSGPGGGDLFIVDNSISGWTALEYLRQWTDVAARLATRPSTPPRG
ncbi:MAG: hypothetical protein OXG47_00525 [bacterium]|nr:hypothetical protein [bacterium]